ncbi:hypothetical protein SKAU_G00023320 [Synaphobranchus kaupii]|uniref:Uncharacterized protein n=1 Tax=Synaphobranchus kaupii TaxID=118154 RepID=A0A9Q1JEV8_SYNKA|nr:hypothetical protein SKAU_G00023320 [Synaphobranchus kaupii]
MPVAFRLRPHHGPPPPRLALPAPLHTLPLHPGPHGSGAVFRATGAGAAAFSGSPSSLPPAWTGGNCRSELPEKPIRSAHPSPLTHGGTDQGEGTRVRLLMGRLETGIIRGRSARGGRSGSVRLLRGITPAEDRPGRGE